MSRCFCVYYLSLICILSFNFVPLQPDEISFEEGDILYIIDRVTVKIPYD